jgi:hypothetical protein
VLCLPIKPLIKDHLLPHTFDFLDHSYWVTSKQNDNYATKIKENYLK